MSLRHRPPSSVVARLALARGDALLAAVQLGEGRWAVASRSGLHLVDDDVVAAPWSDVDHGVLDPETRTLTVTFVTGGRRDVVLPETRDAQAFARVFRERVEHSLVHTTTVRLPDGSDRARIAVRRGADERLFTQLLADARLDLRDPAVAAAVDEAEAAARDAVALPR